MAREAIAISDPGVDGCFDDEPQKCWMRIGWVHDLGFSVIDMSQFAELLGLIECWWKGGLLVSQEQQDTIKIIIRLASKSKWLFHFAYETFTTPSSLRWLEHLRSLHTHLKHHLIVIDTIYPHTRLVVALRYEGSLPDSNSLPIKSFHLKTTTPPTP